MNWLVDALAARSARERRLLGILVLVALPAMAYTTILAPAMAARDAALSARDDALALNAWVAARVADMPADTTTALPPPQPIGATGIEQSLITAELRPMVAQLAEGDDGIIDLRFDAVTFVRLASWVSAQTPDWGYGLSQFDIRAIGMPGKVSASLTLTPVSEQN